MFSRIAPGPFLRTVSKLSTFDSITAGSGRSYKGPGPWVLTIPQLETNTESSALLPWKSQIPMTVRYRIPDKAKSKRSFVDRKPEVANLLNIQSPLSLLTLSIPTPNGVAIWGNISTPEKDEETIIEDPVVTRETYKTRQKGTHLIRINKGRPKAQFSQRIRRKRRRTQKVWDTRTKDRMKMIVKLREESYKTEKKRVQSSDWWDWYVPYDNKPMQF